jgi:hypothetical protein
MFRWVIAGLCIAANSINFHKHFAVAVGGHWGNYFIYLTNCGITLCLLTSVYGSLLASFRYFRSQDYDSDFDLEIYWWLFNVTLVLALVVTISY